MVYMLLGTGFDVTEAMVPLVMMRRAGIDVCTVGINGKTVYGSRDIGIVADIELCEMDLTNLEGIILPGGLGGVEGISQSGEARALITAAWGGGAWVAAICAAPTLLGEMGLLTGRRAVCYPGMEDGLTGALPCPGECTVVADLVNMRNIIQHYHLTDPPLRRPCCRLHTAPAAVVPG